ncbi:hypothetical protein HZH66_012601 [Vespula vulgaris]|uniref:Uncharacterized protein n=1 Tax=Vespula vulgaris TaxID=7454 RepID=A0A834J9B9_VESVU|nr:hypothetical protein HZH66_012601 [Vespula vulgaris]
MQLLSWAFTYNAWTPQIGKGFMRSCTTLDKSTKAGRDDDVSVSEYNRVSVFESKISLVDFSHSKYYRELLALAFECLPEQPRETLAGAVLILDASVWLNFGTTVKVPVVAAVAAVAAAAASPPPPSPPPTLPDQPR